MIDDRLDADQEIDQLVGGYTHAERHLTRTDGKERAERHLSTHPSLLRQLRALATGLPGLQEDAARRIPDSTPPGGWGALTALLRIEQAAAAWVDRLAMPLRADVEGNLRFLLAQATPPLPYADGIAADIHRWWTIARIEAGWDEPPRTLQDPCPYDDCRARAIRVRPGAAAAWCSECGATWDQASIGVLGGMLQAGRDDRAKDAAVRRAAERQAREQAQQAVSA